MDLITLATTALTFATPYLVKSGEKIAENVGEEIWNFIKKPFSKNETEMRTIENREDFKLELVNKLEEDSDFEQELRSIVEKANEKLANNIQQNINNHGSIEKQVNIGNVSGDINL